jgi:hypothetical protein
LPSPKTAGEIMGLSLRHVWNNGRQFFFFSWRDSYCHLLFLKLTARCKLTVKYRFNSVHATSVACKCI